MRRTRPGPRPTPSQVVGVPLMPPARITAAVTRIRDRVTRLHRRLAPPPVQILESALGLLDHRVIVALCEIGVPEALDGAMSIDELARRTNADVDMIERMVRFAATRGWLGIDRRGRVRPNAVTDFLRPDHPGGWRAWVEFAGGREVVRAVEGLSASTSANPFEHANGATFFEWMEAHPDRGEVFDRAMEAGARMHGLALAHALDWEPATSVCDVGGGTGLVLATLADTVPGLTGELLELPGVAARAIGHDRVKVTAGDAFAAVPRGHGIYLLVNVVHDWDDDHVVDLLASVGQAARPTGRLIVVDAEATLRPAAGLPVASDVLMAALAPGGRERTTAEIRALAGRAGLRLVSRTPLPSGDVAWTLEVDPADPQRV